MINTLYLPELREMLAASDEKGLHEFCTAIHPAQAAEFMGGLSATELWAVLQATDAESRADIFCYLEEELQDEILESGQPHQLSQLIANMPPDDRVDLLNRADPSLVETMMPLVPTEERQDILQLSAYPEETAGSVMTTEVARLSEALTVREALGELARQTKDLETIYYVYLVDDQNRLHGIVSARQLVTHLGRPETRLSELMERNLVTVLDTDDQEIVAEKVANYDFIAIPVVDADRHLVGIITHDDIIDVIQEEATEDAHRAGAVEPLEESYLATPWWTLTHHRAGWLGLLFAAALVTAGVLQSHEEKLAEVHWLAFFLVLVISSGGNSGSQSATLIIRSLTTKEVSPSDWWTVMWRELWIGTLLGLMLGVAGYIAVLCFVDLDRPIEALVVPVTVVLVVVCGTMFGSLLPLLFKRIGWDPALMSTPFVAGMIDIVGIVIYMYVAQTLIEKL
jgi:magnesium transporter